MSYTPSNSFSKIDDAYVTDIVEAIGEKRTSTYNGNFDTINGAEIADAIRELNLTDALAMRIFDNPASNSNATYSVTNTAERDISEYAFYHDIKLASVNLPNATSIGLNAFASCTSLVSADFSNLINGTNNIFASCTSLRKVKFGNLTAIGNSNSPTSSLSATFYNCKALSLADFRQQTVIPTAGNYIFCTSLNSGLKCYIVVPDDLAEDWKVATNWSKYHTGGTYGSYYTICTEAEYNTARASDSTLPALD